MVNIREGIREALERELIQKPTAEALLAEATNVFYPRRSWPAIQESGASLGLPAGELASLKAFVAEARPNLKRDDAVAMLRRMAAADDVPHRPNFEFEHAYAWRILRQRLAV